MQVTATVIDNFLTSLAYSRKASLANYLRISNE